MLASWVHLGQPAWLLAAVAAAVPVALVFHARRRGRAVPTLNVLLQCLAIAAIAGALAQPTVPLGARGNRHVLVLRDVSASCRGQANAELPLPEDLPAERYDFATAVAPAGTDGGDANETNLAGALRLALARRKDLSGLIVRTDGRFTDDGWRAPADALGRANVPVAIVAMDSPPADARVAELAAERDDDAVHLAVTVASNALLRRTVTLRRHRPPAATPLLTRTLDLLPGQPATFRLTETPPPTEAAVYRVELAPGDALAGNDSAEALVLPARTRFAVVGDSAPVAGLGVTAVAPAAAPQTAAGWAAYAAVVLVDSTGTVLSPNARAALGEYVRAGGGLVLVGAGPHGSPDDRHDPLNEAAALLANPCERRPLHLIVALDASGSMAEAVEPLGPRIKFHQAAEAVLSLRRHLADADALTVLTFNDSARAIYDSGPRAIDFGALAEALGGVRPAGGTDVFQAIKLAAGTDAFPERDAMLLVVSDLLTKPFRADRAADLLGGRKLSLAVVAIGSASASAPAAGPIEALVRRLGAPPIVRREHLAGLAGVFARLLRDRRGDAVRHGQFRAATPQETFGRAAGELPQTARYLLCAPQPNAKVLARVADGDPLLARRRVGLGRSVALALPAGRDENPAWHASGELVRLTIGAARWARRPEADPRFAGRVRRRAAGPGPREHLAVRVDAADANGPMNRLELIAEVHVATAGEGGLTTTPLRQTAPGRYEASVPVLRGGAALAVRLASERVVFRAAVPRGAPAELATVGTDWETLRELAERTGGRITPSADLAELATELASRARMDLWPVLLGIAAAVMLIEWAAARVVHRAA